MKKNLMFLGVIGESIIAESNEKEKCRKGWFVMLFLTLTYGVFLQPQTKLALEKSKKTVALTDPHRCSTPGKEGLQRTQR